MAPELVSSAVTGAVESLAKEYASPYVSYFFRFGTIVEEFKDQRKQLELKKDRVKNDVDVAKRKTEEIEKDVQEWLKEAEKQLEETQRLEAEIERQKCFNWCPSWGWRYCLSKKVAKKTPYITKLLQKCDFQRVGIRRPLQGIEFFPSKDFKSSESSNSAFDGIMKALNTNGVNMIGLYGMPGVGKTTLAKEVGKHAKEQKQLFDNVVMVTMSQTPNISNIQDRIAELLGLEFKAITEEGKAEELWRRLKGEKILIIIDDVWNEFRLQTIGIPSGVEHDGCKILLTTRLQQICVRMKCQEKFQLDVLSEDEAWALFKDNADLTDATPTLNNIAKEVASECKGLPLAIVTIGKALKGASVEKWTVVNRRFKESRHEDNEDFCKNIYKCLQISYDYLTGDKIRSCFLLCSLFPEDFLINVELLIIFGIGHGLFSHIYKIESLRGEIGEALRKLQDSGLLLKSEDDDDDDDVSMHDVVRDFSHWIISKGENMFMVRDGLAEWPVSESFGCYTAISFWNSNINNFPDKMEFSKLQIFAFTGKNFVRVPSALVKGMKNLRILYLKNVAFSLEVFQFVRNLRTLYFEDCELENISSLKILEKLEILALLDTNIYELPEELVALHGLKSLHFSYIGERRSNFPPNLLSRLTSLQELHVTCPNNVNLWELNSLSRLTALSLEVSTDHQCFQENFVFPKLQRYKIAVGASLSFMQGLKFKALEIGDFSSSFSAFKELFCNVEKLDLEKVMEHKNIVPDVDQEGLNELTSLQLWSCDDMECLMDTTGENAPNTAFSNLVEFGMGDMDCLKELCHGPPPISFLQKLKDMNIQDCGKLKEVFQMDGILEQEEIQTPLLSNLTSLSLWLLPELESIWTVQPTHKYHASLQSLKDVRISVCNKLKSIFSTCVAQSLLHLERLSICSCGGLEQVFDFPQEMAELEVPPLSNLILLELIDLRELKWIWKGPAHFVNLQSLKDMKIERCVKLTYLFTIPLAQNLVHLEELVILGCDSLEHVIMEEAENGDEIVSSMSGDSLCWPKLKTLIIGECRSLKYVFPVALAQGLPYLQSVRIFNCPQLKQIFNMTKEKGGNSDQDIVLQSLQILKLENLENLDSFCLVSQPLKEFKLSNCPRLTRFENQQGVVTWQTELKDGIKKFLCNAKRVTMGAVMYPKNLIPNVDPEGLNEVTFLTLENDKMLECLIDTTDQGYVSTIAFINLEELVIRQMIGFKMLCNGPFPKGFLQNLKKVRFIGCGKLKYLFSPVLAQTLVLLQQLTIEDCNELEYIITDWEIGDNIETEDGHLHPLLLPKLTTLKISDCPRLKYGFKIPLGQVLPQLKSVSIAKSPQLKHVFNVAKIKNGVNRDAIRLPCLRDLRLRSMTNLDFFCSENYAVVSSSLEKLSVEDCPRLEIANIQQKVNKEVQQKCPIQVTNFQCLKELEVSKNNRLKSLFPCMVARNLLQLEILHVISCEELEGIIEMDQTSIASSSHDHLQPISFPSLQCIWIDGCSNLKSLFPIRVTCSLSRLREIRIQGAFELEQVFGYQGELNVEDDQKRIVFPELEKLILSKLPSLKSFAPMGYHFRFPYLDYFNVDECFKLTKSLSMSKLPANARTQASHLIKNNATEGFTTMEEIVDNPYIMWRRRYAKDEIPIFMNLGETKIMLHKEMESFPEILVT